MALNDFETIVIVMLENRSFDHMLGYLGMADRPPEQQVEGLSSDSTWLYSYANVHAGNSYLSRRIGPDIQTITDPKHNHSSIAMQINTAPADANLRVMGGFVDSYVAFASSPLSDPSLVMGYYDDQSVPMFDFFARNFMVCDHWFAALPTGTQPNRLMAMSGTCPNVDNASLLLADQPLVYDWLNHNNVPWCAYQWGDFFPFFSLMPGWLPEIVASLTASDIGERGHFQRYGRLAGDWASPQPMPNVIFIEPEYSDGPHANPCDDHCPTGVAKGQAFLADIYNTLASNSQRWAKTLLIVTYDEHGGFHDHVQPPAFATTVAGYDFATRGVRVPAFLISPQIEAGRVFKGHLDHTSMLAMLAERFTPGAGYSAPVNARQVGLDRISSALEAPNANQTAKVIPEAAIRNFQETASALPITPPIGSSPHDPPNAQALHQVAVKAANDHPAEISRPGWAKLRAYLADHGPPPTGD